MGGYKLIKMEELSRIFASLGFKNVKTYIQSGNVIFETEEKNSELLTKRIENQLQKRLGYQVATFVRTLAEVTDLVMYNPFKNIKTSAKIMLNVTFLSWTPDPLPKLPLLSSNRDVEIFQIRNKDAFGLTRKIKGRSGFPSNFLEKKLGVIATTRKWTTVCKIVAL